MKLTKCYQLQILPNFHKLEEVRYNASRYKLYQQHFTTQLYYNSHIPYYSTKGMGMLANQAQKQAIGIVKGEKAAAKELNRKSNCPQIKYDSCPATIAESKDSTFDYWLTLNSQWKNKVKIPVKSHSKLNESLRTGWELSNYCELFKDKNNKWYVRVFVSKEVPKALPQTKSLGVDVGIYHASTRSDNYLGKNLKNILKQETLSQAERQRQKHKKVSVKTKLKQLLGVEVSNLIRRSKKLGTNIVIENPKCLANLKVKGFYNRWAKAYFGNRLQQRAKEEGIWLVFINPAYTSIKCSCCGKIDRKSRVKQDTFKCTSCGNTLHADINAARNIARIGQERVDKYLLDKNPARDTLRTLK